MNTSIIDTDPLFESTPIEGVQLGHCAMFDDAACRLVYVGPLASAPDPTGLIVFLNPADFAKLQTYHRRKQH